MELKFEQENQEEEIKKPSRKKKFILKILELGLMGISITIIILFSRYLILMGGAF